MSHAGHVLLAGLGKIASGGLSAALQQVAYHGALAQLIPVLQGPAELVNDGGHEDGRVGHAAGDDHIGPLLQGLQDALYPHVGVGGDNLARELGQGLVRLPHLGVHVLVNDGEQVVPGDAGNFHTGEAVLLGDFHALFGGRLGVGGAHVGDELHLMRPAQGEGLLHAVLQQAVISLGGVLQLGLLADGDGALRQALIADVIQLALLDELQGGLQAVAGVARAAADADGFHGITSFLKAISNRNPVKC